MRSFFIIVLVLAIIALIVYFWQKDDVSYDDNNEAAAYCTMDAMACPDGSYVGRIPPSCEFASCPASTTNSSVIQADTNLNAGVSY